MTTFLANLSFLWNNLSLPNAIRAAKSAGFAGGPKAHTTFVENFTTRLPRSGKAWHYYSYLARHFAVIEGCCAHDDSFSNGSAYSL